MLNTNSFVLSGGQTTSKPYFFIKFSIGTFWVERLPAFLSTTRSNKYFPKFLCCPYTTNCKSLAPFQIATAVNNRGSLNAFAFSMLVSFQVPPNRLDVIEHCLIYKKVSFSLFLASKPCLSKLSKS